MNTKDGKSCSTTSSTSEQHQASDQTSQADANRKTERPDDLKHSLDARLSRIEGQIRGLRRMIQEDTYCDDILGQIDAAKGALSKVSLVVLEHHLKHCLWARAQKGDESVADELFDTLRKMN